MLNTIESSKFVNGMSDIRRRILLRIPETQILLDHSKNHNWDLANEKIFERKVAQVFRSLINPIAISAVEKFFNAADDCKNHWWSWKEIFSATTMTIGLLGLDSRKPVPLHDHPFMHTILVLISGKVVVDQYDVRDSAKRHDHILQLRQIQSRELFCGDVSIVYPNYANIHALHCYSNSAILLSLQFCEQKAPSQNQEKSWYFPLYPQEKSQPDIWVKKLSLRS